MSIISRLLSGRDAKPKNAKTRATNPYRISRPVAGFVCFEPALQSLMETDKSSLGPLVSEVHASSGGIVPCNVLFLYCKVDRDGSLPGSNMRIRDLGELVWQLLLQKTMATTTCMHCSRKTIGQRILCLLSIGVARLSRCSFTNCLRP